jgi:hypothetical protein
VVNCCISIRFGEMYDTKLEKKRKRAVGTEHLHLWCWLSLIRW